MNHTVTANELSGRAIGSIFFSGFGAIWLFLSLYAREMLNSATISAVVLGLALLLLAAFSLLRHAKRWPQMPEDPAMSRSFNRVNAIQWTAGAIAAVTLHCLHQDVYTVSAIAVIVGLHLFPLARLFRYPLHYVTGTLLTAWAVAGILFVPTEHLQGITAMGTGLILWTSATVTLVLAQRIARQPSNALTC